MEDISTNIVPPTFNKDSFHCPHCGVLSQQIWRSLYSDVYNLSSAIQDLDIVYCQNPECKKYSLWKDQTMIFPQKILMPIAHIDMPEDVKEIYNEARQVSNLSPRAAAALLRVVLEKLTIYLGEKDGELNTRIANLSKKGLPQKVIQSLDIVRITANEGGSHAGEIDLTGADNLGIVYKLFWLINFIVEKMISEPKHIEEMFSTLPKDKIKGITERDSN